MSWPESFKIAADAILCDGPGCLDTFGENKLNDRRPAAGFMIPRN
jgi:hypothetical protein